MRVEQLKILNFKGIKDLTIEFDPDGTSIYGDNATGKTSIADAFFWLLFGKDSLNQSAFEIKPIGSNGVETVVQAVLDLAARPGPLTLNALTLKKVYSEKWTKKRGSAQAEFTGHTIDYFVDGVPSKKKEFDEAVASICNEHLFRLLTNPRYFNEVLHWQDRRKLLLEACGDISDADVIASDKTLAPLPKILGKHSLEDYRKIIKANLIEINRELLKIPVRIDEISASRIDAPRDPETVKAVIEVCKGRQKELATQLNQIENGGEIAALQKQIAEIDTKIIDLRNKEAAAHRSTLDAHDESRRALVAAVHKAEDALAALKRQKSDTGISIQLFGKSVQDLEARMATLRAEWSETNAAAIEITEESVCPTCGQAIPEEQLEKARQDATEAHNSAKAQMLTEISAKGKAAKELAETKRAEIKTLQETWDALEIQIQAATKASQEAGIAVIAHDSGAPEAPPANPAIADMADTKAALLLEISAAKEGSNGSADAVRAQIAKCDADIETHQAELLAIEANKKVSARVAELKAEERGYAAEYEAFERQMHLTEEFHPAQGCPA
jgi:DNA repair exonuclease SbcCD ATPase subunit